MEHFLKFLVVGGIGFVINTIALIVGVRLGFRPSFSGMGGAELAIISNFILNNFFTFSDRSLSLSAIPAKFIQFNILSFGSAIIQFLFLRTGENVFGLKKFKEPVWSLPALANLPFRKIMASLPMANKITAYLVFYVAGVGVGLIVNFLVYNFIIWR